MSEVTSTGVEVPTLRGRTPQMLHDLATLVEAESPSSDIAATRACAEVADEIGARVLGSRAERIESDGRMHLAWRFGDATDVLLVGHVDTVWPVGTLARWPFRIDDEIASGPGCFDMKAGVVQLFHALGVVDDLSGVAVLLTTDEEIGAPSSRSLIESMGAAAKAALVLEPSDGGALKTERKGVAHYRIHITGRAAHAGLEPHSGVNAAHELAHQIIAIAQLEHPEAGTTVTPTVASAGTSSNTVPAEAAVSVDVRTATVEEQERVDAALHALSTVLRGASVRVEPLSSAPPLTAAVSSELFSTAQRVARQLGLGPLRGVAVGGASDGNFIAALGVPTLDGLGAVGGGAHAEGEHVVIATMAERAALLAGLVAELTGTTA